MLSIEILSIECGRLRCGQQNVAGCAPPIRCALVSAQLWHAVGKCWHSGACWAADSAKKELRFWRYLHPLPTFFNTSDARIFTYLNLNLFGNVLISGCCNNIKMNKKRRNIYKHLKHLVDKIKKHENSAKHFKNVIDQAMYGGSKHFITST